MSEDTNNPVDEESPEEPIPEKVRREEQQQQAEQPQAAQSEPNQESQEGQAQEGQAQEGQAEEVSVGTEGVVEAGEFVKRENLEADGAPIKHLPARRPTDPAFVYANSYDVEDVFNPKAKERIEYEDQYTDRVVRQKWQDERGDINYIQPAYIEYMAPEYTEEEAPIHFISKEKSPGSWVLPATIKKLELPPTPAPTSQHVPPTEIISLPPEIEASPPASEPVAPLKTEKPNEEEIKEETTEDVAIEQAEANHEPITIVTKDAPPVEQPLPSFEEPEIHSFLQKQASARHPSASSTLNKLKKRMQKPLVITSHHKQNKPLQRVVELTH